MSSNIQVNPGSGAAIMHNVQGASMQTAFRINGAERLSEARAAQANLDAAALEQFKRMTNEGALHTQGVERYQAIAEATQKKQPPLGNAPINGFSLFR